MKIQYTEIDLIKLKDEFQLYFKVTPYLQLKKETLGIIRKDSSFLNSLNYETGIYYFIQNNKVKYVGRALPSVGLKRRIINQITAFGDSKWDTVIKDDSVEIGVIIFKKENWYFVSALEHYLIENLGKPIFNKRS